MSKRQSRALMNGVADKLRRGPYRPVWGGIQINDRALEMRICWLAERTGEPVEVAIERAVDERRARIGGRRPVRSSKKQLSR